MSAVGGTTLTTTELGALAELLRKLDGTAHVCPVAGGDRACDAAYALFRHANEIGRLRFLVEDAYHRQLHEETR